MTAAFHSVYNHCNPHSSARSAGWRSVDLQGLAKAVRNRHFDGHVCRLPSGRGVAGQGVQGHHSVLRRAKASAGAPP